MSTKRATRILFYISWIINGDLSLNYVSLARNLAYNYATSTVDLNPNIW